MLQAHAGLLHSRLLASRSLLLQRACRRPLKRAGACPTQSAPPANMAAATAGGGAHRGSPALLPWTAAAEHLVQPTVQPPAAAPPPQLSLVDRLAAPAAFLHQALVFDRALDARALRAALAEVLALMPTLACRATKDVVSCAEGGTGCAE